MPPAPPPAPPSWYLPARQRARPRPFLRHGRARSLLVDPRRLARSGQWRRWARPEPRWRRRRLRAGGPEAAAGAAPCSAPRSAPGAGRPGVPAPRPAGWPARRARPALRHGGRERQAVLEAERQAAGQVSPGEGERGPRRPPRAPAEGWSRRSVWGRG